MRHWPPIAIVATAFAFVMCVAALWGHDFTEACAWGGYFLLNLQGIRDYIRDSKLKETFE